MHALVVQVELPVDHPLRLCSTGGKVDRLDELDQELAARIGESSRSTDNPSDVSPENDGSEN